MDFCCRSVFLTLCKGELKEGTEARVAVGWRTGPEGQGPERLGEIEIMREGKRNVVINICVCVCVCVCVCARSEMDRQRRGKDGRRRGNERRERETDSEREEEGGGGEE